MTGKTWFITGCSRGFGRLWGEAALRRGDRVVLTARDVSTIEALAADYPETALALALDVTDRDRVLAALKQAHAHFGRLDVVLSNAGYGLLGAIEEVEEAEARAVIDTNFFGTLWVAQGALPLFRAQGGGHLIAVSSMAGVIGEATLGLYNASKWAVEGAMDALSREAAHLGIKVTLVEPGPYTTDFGSANSLRISPTIAAYDEPRRIIVQSVPPSDIGIPEATVNAMMQLVDAEHPPLRFILGKAVRPRAAHQYEQRWSDWNDWASVSDGAHGK